MNSFKRFFIRFKFELAIAFGLAFFLFCCDLFIRVYPFEPYLLCANRPRPTLPFIHTTALSYYYLRSGQLALLGIILSLLFILASPKYKGLARPGIALLLISFVCHIEYIVIMKIDDTRIFEGNSVRSPWVHCDSNGKMIQDSRGVRPY